MLSRDSLSIYLREFMSPKKVLIREVGPREGFQIYPSIVSMADKRSLIESLALTGVSEIEVTSFVRADLVPQMADAEELVTSLQPRSDVKFKALYLNTYGFKKAESFPVLQNEAWLITSISETFFKKNNNRTHKEFEDGIEGWLKLFAEYNKPLHGIMFSTAFGCHYEGECVPEKTLSYCENLLRLLKTHGVTPKECMFADTVGMGLPEHVQRIIKDFMIQYPSIAPGLHLHDTGGRARENAEVGLECGVAIFESSIAGMGGCPFTEGAAGNVATEDLVALCHDRGVETGVSLEKLTQSAELARQLTP